MSKKRNKLTLVAIGGLANRMRAILSGIKLAQDTGNEMEIVWGMNSECRCHPSILFDLEKFENIRFIIPDIFRFNLKYEIPRKKNLYISSLFRKIRYSASYNFVECSLEPEAIADSLRDGDVIISSGLEFFDFPQDFYNRYFHPTDQIKKIVAAKVPDFTRMVGVHIRRTDNELSIKHSPLEKFENAMSEILEQEPTTRFYLATDDSEVRERLTRVFGSRILQSGLPADRNSAEGIIEAWSELLVLSRCNSILGSYWSSFSECASYIGGIPLRIIKT